MILRRTGWGIALGLGLAAALMTAPEARAQFQSTDPYDPYGVMYRPFVYPTGPMNPALPNQGRLDVLGAGSAADTSINGAGGAADLFGRGVGRLEGSGPDRSYRPNADDDFYEKQNERHALYWKAMAEKDVKKRAKMLREYEELSKKASRSASSKSNRTVTGAARASAAPLPRGVAKPDLLRGSRSNAARNDARSSSGVLSPRTPSAPRPGLLRRPSDSDPAVPKPSTPITPTDILNRSLENTRRTPAAVDSRAPLRIDRPLADPLTPPPGPRVNRPAGPAAPRPR